MLLRPPLDFPLPFPFKSPHLYPRIPVRSPRVQLEAAMRRERTTRKRNFMLCNYYRWILGNKYLKGKILNKINGSGRTVSFVLKL